MDTVGVAADALGTTVGLPIQYQVHSGVGQAIDSGALSTEEFYSDTAIDMATFGVVAELDATYEWSKGEIDDQEFRRRMAAIAVSQALAAKSLKGTEIGTAPIYKVPGIAIRQTVETGRAFMADERGSPLLRSSKFPAPKLEPRTREADPLARIIHNSSFGCQRWTGIGTYE